MIQRHTRAEKEEEGRGKGWSLLNAYPVPEVYRGCLAESPGQPCEVGRIPSVFLTLGNTGSGWLPSCAPSHRGGAGI